MTKNKPSYKNKDIKYNNNKKKKKKKGKPRGMEIKESSDECSSEDEKECVSDLPGLQERDLDSETEDEENNNNSDMTVDRRTKDEKGLEVSQEDENEKNNKDENANEQDSMPAGQERNREDSSSDEDRSENHEPNKSRYKDRVVISETWKNVRDGPWIVTTSPVMTMRVTQCQKAKNEIEKIVVVRKT